MTTYSNFYIDGIVEGRKLLKNFSYLDAEYEYNMNKQMVTRHSGAIKEHYKGLRDFWNNQRKMSKGQV